MKREIRHFHVVVMQWRQRNVEKIVVHVQSCCFANFNLQLFWRSRCRPWRRILRSLLLLYVTPAFAGKNNLVPRALFPPHLQSQGKAPWRRGWGEKVKTCIGGVRQPFRLSCSHVYTLLGSFSCRRAVKATRYSVWIYLFTLRLRVQWRIQGRDPRARPPVVIFSSNWDPKGRNNFFWDRASFIFTGSLNQH